ncbi:MULTISPECIES: LLM class flavin-dependent oxidoreductase [unclassified Chelatococcus]|jgi:limonene 1,2-monooxygenase|uniref:LLM class flavin-dependent oxidoreductase n=1 Tax=unclassified Chelatococcus TaxID=2638111 RepID=UPI0020BEE489|nr:MULTISPECIES: LLM class flavin-dependent oxidoreductase [unclassified Chelatococcus]MCO5075205.1 LLM class flavin-dependent oxidoreductase [Chelatococcus sp.]CAH1657474.1 Limonene 1,2-monooxygenase [Hyphomicrobiales bacterium]CAH1689153.1 Limonene 1,2-monooxygenase [Hyphomicrobiales bacterium]
MASIPLRHGMFLPPIHPNKENPTLAIQRDMELVEHLDRLGYEEAWIGEHHSSGAEIIASPELFIAAVAERTRRIRLGTGVISLPYHSPLTVANRIIQLDHQTRGRVMMGVGPGLLTADAMMMGIEPEQLRDRMSQALDVILRLLDGQTVTEKTEWYNLVDARVHLLPYTKPHLEVCVASTLTPSGGRNAGKYGLGMLCVAATSPTGFDVLGTNWRIANEVAAEHGHVMDRSRLRLAGLTHIAETREQAIENVKFGLRHWLDYREAVNPTIKRKTRGETFEGLVEAVVKDHGGVIGTPDDLIAKIEQLYEKQGEFGAFLQVAHNWADFEATKKSWELVARYVIPHFSGANRNRDESLKWSMEHGMEYGSRSAVAQRKMFEKHEAEQQAKQSRKD